MNHIIPQNEQLNGEEMHHFSNRLQPIIYEMNASVVSEQYKSLMLFSLKTGKARIAAVGHQP